MLDKIGNPFAICCSWKNKDKKNRNNIDNELSGDSDDNKKEINLIQNSKEKMEKEMQIINTSDYESSTSNDDHLETYKIDLNNNKNSNSNYSYNNEIQKENQISNESNNNNINSNSEKEDTILSVKTDNNIQEENKKEDKDTNEDVTKEIDIKVDEKEKENVNNKKDPIQNETILIGLNNIGATCYMNATLQSLSNTNELTNYFLNKYEYEPNNNKKIMSNEFYKVLQNLWDKENNNKSYSPDDFKTKLSEENPLFAGIAANDSKDLINFLLERLHKELNVINNDNNSNNYNYNQNDQIDEQKMLNLFINDFQLKYNSIISHLFYGIVEIKSQCQGCKYIKYNFQIYSFIEFPLERVNQYCFNTGKRNNYYNMNNNQNPDINLYECFEYYSNPDLMTGDNQMYCNICKRSCDAFYGSSLYTAPNYLIINLNRGRGAVYKCTVIFPEILYLTNFVTIKTTNTKFELYAVICHIGPSSDSGHFVAYCKNRMDKKWYLYNDAFVSPCDSPNEYKKGMAYILFYQVLE